MPETCCFLIFQHVSSIILATGQHRRAPGSGPENYPGNGTPFKKSALVFRITKPPAFKWGVFSGQMCEKHTLLRNWAALWSVPQLANGAKYARDMLFSHFSGLQHYFGNGAAQESSRQRPGKLPRKWDPFKKSALAIRITKPPAFKRGVFQVKCVKNTHF